jgi:hypothetical protein
VRLALVILSTVLSLTSLALCIRSVFVNDILQHMAIGKEKTARGVMTWSGKLSYRSLSAPLTIQSLPGGWHYRSTPNDSEIIYAPIGDTFLGFEATQKYAGTAGAMISGLRISIPLLLPFAVFAIPPAFWWSRRRKYPEGHCQKCGYDLRETPERCPECGFRSTP